jgi:riboflavin kinase/FMN adenylyltransferase
MKVLRSLEIQAEPRGPTAVAIGNFDGVHLGHRRILSFLVERARQDALESLVLSFSPHPGKVTGQGKIQLLQTEGQKLATLEKIGMDAVCLIPFDREFARKSADEFIRSVLIPHFNAHVIVVGEHFRFGRDRSGDTNRLRELGRKYALTLYPIPSLVINGLTVSSSLIRNLIRDGRVNDAAQLLGSPYVIQGTVVKGQTVGRGLGFPTANLDSPNEILPPGVFVTISSVLGREIPSVTNIGVRPTFSEKVQAIETHLLDFAEDIYDHTLTLQFLKKIRDEFRFDSPEQLKAQIRNDLAEVRSYFATRSPASR